MLKEKLKIRQEIISIYFFSTRRRGNRKFCHYFSTWTRPPFLEASVKFPLSEKNIGAISANLNISYSQTILKLAECLRNLRKYFTESRAFHKRCGNKHLQHFIGYPGADPGGRGGAPGARLP